jgi:dipeptidyl aminopeptidase/acylaminoacyl peptidase
VDLRKGTLEPLFDPNPQVADWTLARFEVVEWQSPEGATIRGLLWSPATEPQDGPPPLVVWPHGGPDGVSTAWFNPVLHVFAARGYAVLQPNYRGGLGRGMAFYAENRGRLGDIEFMDIEAGVDHLIATGRASADRLYYGGWSWGGYLTAWTIGHTDRYRAAVAGAAVVDTTSQYVTSDINHGAAAEWEFKGTPWQQTEAFDRASPARFLAGATIPTLILHGEDDARVPFAQGLTLYRALSDVGCEVRMLAYPGEGHGLRKPAHNVHRWSVWLDWYDAH